MRKNLWTLMVPMIVVVVVLMGCGGGKTTTITEREFRELPEVTDPPIVAEVGILNPDQNGDLVEVTATINGIVVKDGDTMELTSSVLHVTSALYGLGVAGKEGRSPRLNITDIEVDSSPVVSFAVQVGTLPTETLWPGNGAKEIVFDTDLSFLAGQTVPVTIGSRADPALTVVWGARRLGIKPMPTTGRTVVERTIVTKTDYDAFVSGVVGFALGWLANMLVPGSGIVLTCPDPTDSVTVMVKVPSTTPPPAEQVLTSIEVVPAATTVTVGSSQAFVATAYDQNGLPMAATITWSLGNAVGSIGPLAGSSTVFTATIAGTTTLTATATVGMVTVSGNVAITVMAEQPPPLTTWGGEPFDSGLVNFFTDQGPYVTLVRVNEEFQDFIPFLMYSGTAIPVNSTPKSWTVNWELIKDGVVAKAIADTNPRARVRAVDLADGSYSLRAKVRFATMPEVVHKLYDVCVIQVN